MRNKFFTLISILTIAGSLMAAVGPQSIQVTFNSGNVEGWKIIGHNNEDLTNQATVSGGLMNVVMNEQNAEDHKYRADLKYMTSDVFSFDKNKDKIWAIKVSGTYPGTNANKCQFELQYKNESGVNTTFTRFTGTPHSITCSDGVIFYFDLTTKSSDYAAIQDGNVTVNLIHFLFADAVITDAANAHYNVDWIATFTSVDELSFYKDWKDEQTDFSEPVFEYCFRPKASSDAYDSGYPKNGVSSEEFEGNYQARIFAIQYYLIDNYSADKWYTISMYNTTSNTEDLALWNFSDKINVSISANDIRTKATSVVGIAPSATEGTTTTPAATATFSGGSWKFVIPAGSLTEIGTVGTKTLVGVFITSKTLTTSKSGKFATTSNTSKAHPAFAIAPIANKTQKTSESSLATAVTNANANDVLIISEDITVSARIDIAKALTIQGATGTEKITCAVAANSIMVLANGEGDEHTITFKNLVIDGNNVSRSIQTLEAAQNANICLDGVQFVNTAYSKVTGDVKNSGNKNIILKGTNSIPNGIYLNMNKRVKHDGATHTNPIKIVLANDYVAETYSIVLTCSDPTLYTAELANGTAWQLFKKESQNELAGRTMPAHTYDLTVSAAGMATLVLGFDAELPSGVKAYTLTNNSDADIWAEEVNQITKNQPVLVVADADTYTFTSAAGVALDEQADPSYGCLKGTYEEEINVPESAADVYNYILKNGDAGVGFYKVPDGSCKIRSNRAYLSCGYNSVVASAPMRIRFKEDTATGVEQTVAQQSARKLIINGELFILRDEHLYRIDGRMVK